MQSLECKMQNGGFAFYILPSALDHSAQKLVPEVGITPTSPRLQRGANLPQLLGVLAHGQSWSSRQVTLLRLPVISRVLCF